jgi:glycosyltransferase involved in cell wall biosynthesis
MSAGLPVVAFKSCPSIEDIVIDEKTGLLADNDIDSLADKLRVLMNDARMRVQIGHNAHIEMEKFESNRIWEKWDHIIQTIYNRRDKSIC